MTAVVHREPPARADGLSAVRVWLAAGPAPRLDLAALAAGPDAVLFDDGRCRMAGLGTALDIPLGPDDGGAAVVAQLGAVTLEADVGTAPVKSRGGHPRHPVVAFGALGFEGAPAVLRVPTVLYVEEADGTRWATVTTAPAGPGEAPGPGPDPTDVERWLSRRAADGARAPRSPAGTAVVAPVGGATCFDTALDDALAALRRGELAKVVLARHVDVDLGGAPDVADLLRRWRRLEPACTVFSLPAPDGRFVGASPELLVARHGDAVVSWPLAGTAARRSGDGHASTQDPDGLLASPKDAIEHRLVVEAIARSLRTVCASLTVPDHPELVHLRSVDHLGTRLEGRLRDAPGAGLPDALTLARLLHPTPAVGGTPAAVALARIAATEPAPRGPYAGPVGYLDGDGDGSFVLGIRSALLSGDRARVCAGAGLVAASDAATERAEVDLKLAAVLAALAPTGVSVRASA